MLAKFYTPSVCVQRLCPLGTVLCYSNAYPSRATNVDVLQQCIQEQRIAHLFVALPCTVESESLPIDTNNLRMHQLRNKERHCEAERRCGHYKSCKQAQDSSQILLLSCELLQPAHSHADVSARQPRSRSCSKPRYTCPRNATMRARLLHGNSPPC